MEKIFVVWLIAYGFCPALGLIIVYWRQGSYITEKQPLACLLLGPFTPLIACMPRGFFEESR